MNYRDDEQDDYVHVDQVYVRVRNVLWTAALIAATVGFLLGCIFMSYAVPGS